MPEVVRSTFERIGASDLLPACHRLPLHDAEVIERFYAGRLSWVDKLSALRRGAPTVPAVRAMRAAFSI